MMTKAQGRKITLKMDQRLKRSNLKIVNKAMMKMIMKVGMENQETTLKMSLRGIIFLNPTQLNRKYHLRMIQKR